MIKKTNAEVVDLRKDIKSIENKDYLRTDEFLKLCADQRTNCPVCVRLAADSEVLDDIKEGQKAMLNEIRQEFKEHRALHLTIAGSIGSMRADIDNLKKVG
jgi:hypothetical protein